MDSFSLLDRGWIPVVSVDGERELVSLREALLKASQYRRIDAGHPLQTPALYRLLLSILHRALKGPKSAAQGAEWYLAGHFPAKVESYLNDHADRFDLFGEQPFMQVAGLDPARVGENFRSHWVRLSAEEGSPNTTALFNVEARPGGSRTDPLTPAQAALRLLEHQTFALGGLIKRFTTAARAAPVATGGLFLAEGGDLHQTLCLNLVPYPETMHAQDTPPWEVPALDVDHLRALYDPEKPRAAPGYVSRYTWLSRSILLLPEETAQGVMVRSIGFGAGVPLAGTGEGSDTNIDPMVSLRPSRDPKSDQPFPYKLRRDRLMWRDLTALLPDPAATIRVPDKKGQVKVLPGQPPLTLIHAREVMLKARHLTPPEDDELEMSQEAPSGNLASAEESRPSALARHPVIPVLAFGQLTDQGKAFAMRQETYTLPQTFIENPEKFRDFVQGALGDAGKVGEGLRISVRFLAHALLKKGGERDPHKDDVGKLAAQIPAEPTYWAQLDTPFRTYLLALDAGPTAALANWHVALRQSANAGWRTAEEAAGLNAVGLRAVYLAYGPLGKALKAITPQETTEAKNDANNR